MMFQIQTLDSAPSEAQDALRSVQEKYGFIPNLMGVMAGAPPVLHAYLQTYAQFQRTSLTPAEQQVVLLTVSVTNGCQYCVAAHSVAAQMLKVSLDVLLAIREGRMIQNSRLQALRQFTAHIVDRRGWPTDNETQSFLASGFAPEQILEVMLGIGLKTLSNYVNHLAETPLDPQFAAAKWESP